VVTATYLLGRVRVNCQTLALPPERACRRGRVYRDESATGQPDGGRPRVDRVVVCSAGRDLHISFKVREVERGLHPEGVSAGFPVDEEIGIWSELPDHFSIDLDTYRMAPS
jgi:hypothetical protein